ncbi:MAG: ABC transporter substrate-binding protein [Acidimicrobiia bacterium]
MRLRTIVFVVLVPLTAAACGARFKGHEEAGGSGTVATAASGSTAPESTTTTASQLPSGAKEPGPAPGVTDTEIKIGYLVPRTGAAPVPDSLVKGINTYYNYLNGKGGVHGRKVKVVVADSQSRSDVATDQAKKLIEDDKVFTILSLDRLENQQAIVQYLDQRKFPNIPMQTPADLPQSMAWTFVVTMDQGQQGTHIADYFVKTLKAKKVGIVTEQSPLLDPGHERFTAEVKKLGAKVVYDNSIQGTAQDFGGPVSSLKQSGATAVWLYMAPTPAVLIANQSFQSGYHPTWFANSISWGFNLALSASKDGLKGARAFSPWISLDDPRADTYKQQYTAQNPGETPDDIGIVGWGSGQIVTAGLEAAGAGSKLGQNSFRDAMQHLNVKPDVWVPIAFQPGVRDGANEVAVLKEDGGKWALEHDFTANP